MVQTFTVSGMGVRVAIDLTAIEERGRAIVREAWRDALPDAAETRSAGPVVMGSESFAQEMSQLSTAVTLAALEAQRGSLWMLHAAALALDDGRVVVFVGPSGRGKTTASRALGAVYGYVSDETAAIAPDGAVLPYRKPLSIIEAGHAAKVQRAPSDVGLQPLPDADLRLARIVLLDRRVDGPSEPEVRDVALSEALRDLVEQTSYLPHLERPLATIVSHVAATGGVSKVTYREAEALPAVMPELAAPALTTPVLAAPVDHAGGKAGGRHPQYARVEPLDEVLLDGGDRVALLQPSDTAGGATLRVLDGIGPVLWERCDGASLGDLVDAVVARHGQPPQGDAAALTARALDDLVREGVVTLSAEDRG